MGNCGGKSKKDQQAHTALDADDHQKNCGYFEDALETVRAMQRAARWCDAAP
jgi:hypothetical protein